MILKIGVIMEKLYPIFLIMHLFCAIIFIGYLFFDVFVLPRAKKKASNPESLIESISQTITKFMPFVVLTLLVTGGAMAGKYFATPIETSLQKLLLIKTFLALAIFVLMIFSLSCRFIFKCKNPLGKYIHIIVLSIGVAIALIAKIMFFA